jgi:hypothetical protein
MKKTMTQRRSWPPDPEAEQTSQFQFHSPSKPHPRRTGA